MQADTISKKISKQFKIFIYFLHPVTSASSLITMNNLSNHHHHHPRYNRPWEYPRNGQTNGHGEIEVSESVEEDVHQRWIRLRVFNISERWTANHNEFVSRTVRVFGTNLKVSLYRDTRRNHIESNEIIVIIHNEDGDRLSFCFESTKCDLPDDSWEEEANQLRRSYLTPISTDVEFDQTGERRVFLHFCTENMFNQYVLTPAGHMDMYCWFSLQRGPHNDATYFGEDRSAIPEADTFWDVTFINDHMKTARGNRLMFQRRNPETVLMINDIPGYGQEIHVGDVSDESLQSFVDAAHGWTVNPYKLNSYAYDLAVDFHRFDMNTDTMNALERWAAKNAPINPENALSFLRNAHQHHLHEMYSSVWQYIVQHREEFDPREIENLLREHNHDVEQLRQMIVDIFRL